MLLERHGSVRAAVAAARTGSAGAVAAVAAAKGDRGLAGIDGGARGPGSPSSAVTSPPAPPCVGDSGPCNLTTDLTQALRSIEAALAQGVAPLRGLDADAFAALCVAAAGSGNPTIREEARTELLRRGVAKRVAIVHDGAATLATAEGSDGAGLVVLAGTGSFAFARAADGRVARAGGFDR